MPTASTAKLEKQGSLDANDPLRQGIVMIDHKIRNLEKRKAKLDGYRDLQKSGKDLNSDQLEAISKYDAVIQHLDFARELSKHLTSLALESVKNAKKQARKEAQEKAQQDIARTKEILMIQDLMSNMGQDSVREDLTQGKAKVTLTAEELQQIDDLYLELTPKREEHSLFQDMFQAPAEAMSDLLKGKNKEVCGTTYTALKGKIFEIIQSGYFDNAQPEQAQENVEAVTTAVEPEAAVPEDNGTDTEVTLPLPGAPQTIPEDPSVIACSFQPSHVVVPQNTSPVPPIQPIEEPVKPAQIETAYFTPTNLRVFQSATIDFMQTDLTIQENEVEPAEHVGAPPIPTMTYTNQSFTPMDPSQPGQTAVPPQAVPVLPPQVLPPPVQTIPLQTEPPQIYQNQTDEEKGWSNVGGDGHHQPIVIESDWGEVIDNNGGGGEDSWASQAEQQWSTNQQPPPHNDGFITQGGRGRGGQRRTGGGGGGAGDRNPKGNYNRGGSRGGQGNRSGGGGFRDKEGGGYREGGGYSRERDGGYGGGNSYKDQNSYQNGYQNRGDRSGGRQGPRNTNDRPGGRGGGRGRGGYRGAAGGGPGGGGGGGGYRQQQ